MKFDTAGQLGWLSMNPAARGMESASAVASAKEIRWPILGVGGVGSHVAWNLAACGMRVYTW